MGLYRSVQAVASASGDGPIDWNAVGEAAKGSVAPGSVDLSEAQREGYAGDVRDARDRVSDVAAVEFDLPGTVEVQDRHHWIDANVTTFERLMRPLEQQAKYTPGLARLANTGSMAFALSFLGNNVLGQYDPLLLAEADEHALYFVHPNIERVANELDVERDRFRRWIAFHEVAHAAEFGTAPWLSTHLEETMERTIGALTDGRLDRDSLGELDTTMTAVEGYAELRHGPGVRRRVRRPPAKLEARRSGRGPIAMLVRRLLRPGHEAPPVRAGQGFFDVVAGRTRRRGRQQGVGGPLAPAD